jgi:hypothetical protein
MHLAVNIGGIPLKPKPGLNGAPSIGCQPSSKANPTTQYNPELS